MTNEPTEPESWDEQRARDEPPTDEALARIYERADAQERGDAHENETPAYGWPLDEGILTTDELLNLPEPEFLIDGLLPKDSMTIMYGPTGIAKSFLAASMALSLSTGVDFLGHMIRNPVRSYYIVGEGITGTGQRVKAWHKHHGRQPDDGLHWRSTAVNLANKARCEWLAAVIDHYNIGLIIADTFARCSVGVDENSSKEIGEIVANLDRLRQATGVTVLLVHHSGKDVSKGGRGSSALKAAADAELEVTAGRLAVSKMKDAAEEAPTRFRLEPVANSAVPVADTASTRTLPASAATVLEALEALCITDGHTVASSEWKAAAGIADTSFYRARGGLLQHGLVIQDGVERQARYRPARQVQTDLGEEF